MDVHNTHGGDGKAYKFRRGGGERMCVCNVCVVVGSVKIRHISPWSVYHTRLAGTEIHDEMPAWTIGVDYF